MTTRHGIAILILALSPLHAQVYVDASAPAKFSFVSEYGPTFPQVDAEGASLLQRNFGNGVAVADIDGDGDLDVLMLDQLTRSNVLLRNDLDLGAAEFADATAASGLGDTGHSRTAQFADFDNDGDPDLVLVNDDDGTGTYPGSKIYRNDGTGVFTDVTAGSGFDMIGFFRCGLSVADFDDDGLLDIFATVWTREIGSGSPTFPYRNRLYRNLGSLQFEDITDTHHHYMARDPYQPVSVDFDDDGDVDMFIAIDHTADAYFNNVGGRFFDRSLDVGATHTGNDMGVAVGDIDGDLDVDLFATNITDPDLILGTTQYNALNVSDFAQDGTLDFTNEAGARGVEDTYWAWGTEFTDADNDGDLDLAVVTGFDEFVMLASLPGSPLVDSPGVYFENDGSGVFTRDDTAGLGAGDDSRALVAFDYDRDGDEDLVVGNLVDPSRLYENVVGQDANWLNVRLVQSPGRNRDGVGARIYATAGGSVQRRDILAGRSYLTGTPPEAHFGLGSQASVSELRVVWTDGSETSLFSVAANQAIVVSQGGQDDDLDGVGNGPDCAPGDATQWGPPASAPHLRSPPAADFAWRQPVDSGSTVPTYDVVRSIDAADWSASTCRVAGGSAIEYTDPGSPGAIWYYLVRVRSACGSAVSPATAGPRAVPACP